MAPPLMSRMGQMEESRRRSSNGDINCKMGKVDGIVAEKLNHARKRIRTGFQGFKDFDPLNEDHLRDISSLIKEELSSAENAILTGITRIDSNTHHPSLASKQLKLEFQGKISEEILTGAEIKAEGGVPIKVLLINVYTGRTVDEGLEASLCVEIVLLKEGSDPSEGDDWFEKNIICDTGGKKSLLAGDTLLKLEKGIGVVNNIKFIHRASSVKPPKFCLGARVYEIDARWIKGAKTEPFMVKNFRKKYYVKNKFPSLTDCVSRLKNIHKGGKIAKRLQLNQISTVEDFLIRLLIDPHGLQSIVGTVQKKWIDILTNAQACRDNRMYCYVNSQQKAMIVFNIFGHVLRLPRIMPSENQEVVTQESLLASAYEHWEDVKHFDDEISLEEHLAEITNSWGGVDSQLQNLPVFCDLNPNRENIFEDYNFNTDSVEHYPCFIPHRRSASINLGSLWNFNEPNQEHIVDAVAPAFVGLQDVHNGRPPKMWNIFWCIWRWRSVRKKISSKRCTTS